MITINSFWHGRPLSNLERLAVQSFLDHGHEFRIWCYRPVEGLSTGAVMCDANELVPESEFFTNPNPGFGFGSASPFSDVFRMTLLERYGGWWSDMDVVCLRPWDIGDELVVSSSDEREWGVLANANVLRTPAGHALARMCREILIQRPRDKIGHADGPHAVQKAVKLLNLERALVPPWWFNPIQWRYVKYLIRPEESPFHPRRIKRALRMTERLGRVRRQSYALHLWGEIWTQSGFDRNARYHPRSIFERLKRKHGIS